MELFKTFKKKDIKDFEKDTESKTKISDTVKGFVDTKKMILLR